MKISNLFRKEQSTESNWNVVRRQKPTQTMHNRDIYAEQQLKRGDLPKPITKTSRMILLAAFVVGIGFVIYAVIGVLIYLMAIMQAMGKGGLNAANHVSLMRCILVPIGIKFIGMFLGGGLTLAIGYPLAMRNLQAQNASRDFTDINQHKDDQHIALPQEVMRKFEPAPDAGAHYSLKVSSMISHAALNNKGLKSVYLTKRYTDDLLEVQDENGETVYMPAKEANKKGLAGEVVAYKGEPIYDDDGNREKVKLPMMDKKFMEALFTASGDPNEPDIRKYFDPRKIPYNPGGKNRDRLGAGDKNAPATWADLINQDWEIPDYETQRPAGAYLVDTAPVNTMVLAITRAGKGNLARLV